MKLQQISNLNIKIYFDSRKSREIATTTYFTQNRKQHEYPTILQRVFPCALFLCSPSLAFKCPYLSSDNKRIKLGRTWNIQNCLFNHIMDLRGIWYFDYLLHRFVDSIFKNYGHYQTRRRSRRATSSHHSWTF